MPFKIVRNDITRMKTEAIVNTASSTVTVGPGCESAIYEAAGYDELLDYRKEKIGNVEEGQVFITPAFGLGYKCIIHAVSPLYHGGDQGEEEKLRSCYRNSLRMAKGKGIRSIAFPLISSGGFGYPKEEALRVAVDEINAFLLEYSMLIFLVVFDSRATLLGEKLFPELEAYIDHNYVWKARKKEYGDAHFGSVPEKDPKFNIYMMDVDTMERRLRRQNADTEEAVAKASCDISGLDLWNGETDYEEIDKRLKERITHKTDSFSEYLLYLISSKGMKNADVYKKAVIDKRYFAKLKKYKDFHPEKLKALCLCVGAELNLDETKDLLARAGYALSPSDITDIIFTFFIEHKHFDIIDIDIKLEEYGLPCIIS